MKAVEKVMDSKGKGRKEVQSETNVREVAEMECVVISDDESDFLTGKICLNFTWILNY